jgi:Ni/Co efflux regulator RcnB
MRQVSTSLCAAVALSFAIGGAAPAMAAPLLTPATPSASSDVVQIQHRRHRDDRRDRFERRGNQAYYNGHRGYRDRRPGYRQHNGWWFPPAAFIAGAIIGGGLANQQPQGLCQERWRSYRVSDNSYQPYNGPRRTCVSPYS